MDGSSRPYIIFDTVRVSLNFQYTVKMHLKTRFLCMTGERATREARVGKIVNTKKYALVVAMKRKAGLHIRGCGDKKFPDRRACVLG